MSLQGHIVELQRRHDALKKEIEQEQLHPQTDELKILELSAKSCRSRTSSPNCRLAKRDISVSLRSLSASRHGRREISALFLHSRRGARFTSPVVMPVTELYRPETLHEVWASLSTASNCHLPRTSTPLPQSARGRRGSASAG
jgi:hypothetical protein